MLSDYNNPDNNNKIKKLILLKNHKKIFNLQTYKSNLNQLNMII